MIIVSEEINLSEIARFVQIAAKLLAQTTAYGGCPRQH